MRIAFISTILGYPWGGADTLWTRGAEAALDRGDSVFLAVSSLVTPHARIKALVQRGAQCFERPRYAPATSLKKRLTRKLETLTGRTDPLVAALDQFKPDRVIFSCGGTYDLVLEGEIWNWLRASRVPFRQVANWQPENPVLADDELARITEIFPAAERLFFVSQRNLAVTRRHLLLPLPQAAVIQNPLRAMPTAELAWPKSDTWNFATIGRLDAVKGIDLLCHALAAAFAGQSDWRLNIYGDGPQSSYLRQTIAALSLEKQVSLRGYVKDLGDIWRENHLLVSPARDEGVPMTIPEAMLHSRPVLATCVGGAQDWIEHDQTGFLCAAPTLDLLSRPLSDAWKRRESWRQIGARARVSAAEKYRPDDYLRLIA